MNNPSAGSSSEPPDTASLLSLILGNASTEETPSQERQMQHRREESHSSERNVCTSSAVPPQGGTQGSSNPQAQEGVPAVDNSNTLILLAQYLSEVGATQREHPTVQALLHTVEGAGATTGQKSHSREVQGSTLDNANKHSTVGDDRDKKREGDAEPTVHPCRARGMPMDHNALTAYFVISKRLEHGEGLRCTYAACRDAGVKFRYCSFCKAPVAKRNFRKRHSHSSGTSDSIETSTEKTSQQVQSDLPSNPELQVLRGGDDDTTSIDRTPQIASVTDKEDKTLASSNATTKDSSGVESSGGEAQRDSSTPSPSLQDTRKTRVISPAQLAAWEKLLDNRPSFDEDPELIDAWISKVLEISEPKNPKK